MSVTSLQLKLNKVNFGDTSLEEFCKREVEKVDKRIRNKGLEGDYESYAEAFDDILSDKYFRKGNSVYRIAEEKENDFFVSIKDNKDNTLDVVMYYHDGANTWQDILREEKGI